MTVDNSGSPEHEPQEPAAPPRIFPWVDEDPHKRDINYVISPLEESLVRHLRMPLSEVRRQSELVARRWHERVNRLQMARFEAQVEEVHLEAGALMDEVGYAQRTPTIFETDVIPISRTDEYENRIFLGAGIAQIQTGVQDDSGEVRMVVDRYSIGVAAAAPQYKRLKLPSYNLNVMSTDGVDVQARMLLGVETPSLTERNTEWPKHDPGMVLDHYEPRLEQFSKTLDLIRQSLPVARRTQAEVVNDLREIHGDGWLRRA